MRTNTTRSRAVLALILLAALFALSCPAQAKLLVSTSIDKETLSTDEVALLTINIFNDTNSSVGSLILRIDGGESIVFPENDDKSPYAKIVEDVKGLSMTELRVKIKASSTKKSSANILVYYGEKDPLPYVSGTYLDLKEKRAVVKATASKRLDPEGEKVIVDFSITNSSGQELKNIMAEVAAPQGFDVKTNALIVDSLPDGNLSKRTFEVLAPIGAAGEQKIVLSYGYIDSNGPHYFEKAFTVSFTKGDNTVLLVVGVIVLAVAVFIYVRQTRAKPGKAVIGTGAKKK